MLDYKEGSFTLDEKPEKGKDGALTQAEDEVWDLTFTFTLTSALTEEEEELPGF